MEKSKVSIVVTSIFSPNKSLLALAKGAKTYDWQFVIAGDVSSPKDFHLDGAVFYDINAQRNLKLKYAALCPEKHYTRKNIGYLVAIQNGCNIIVETDDDNIPNAEFWLQRQPAVLGNLVTGKGDRKSTRLNSSHS